MTARKSGPMTLVELAERWQSAAWVAEDFRQELIAGVRELAARGVSESAMARDVGVTRQTIRVWLGK